MITYPNLYHLKYFADAAALGSISRAAEKNFVTHPAVSRAISALEEYLGTPLLEHQKKSFKLTEAGYKVAEQAQTLLLAASNFGNLDADDKTQLPMELKIGISRTLAEAYLSTLLLELKSKFPQVKVKVRFGTANEIAQAVAENTIELGLTIGGPSLATLKQTVVKNGSFILVEGGSKKEWAKNLNSKQLILTEPRVETEKLKISYKKEFGTAAQVLCEVSSWDVIGQLVQKGLGIGLLPDISIKHWPKKSFRLIKTKWFESPYEICVYTLKSQASNQAVEYIKEILA